MMPPGTSDGETENNIIHEAIVYNILDVYVFFELIRTHGYTRGWRMKIAAIRFGLPVWRNMYCGGSAIELLRSPAKSD
jgi:hypothetical protein